MYACGAPVGLAAFNRSLDYDDLDLGMRHSDSAVSVAESDDAHVTESGVTIKERKDYRKPVRAKIPKVKR